MLKTMKRVSIYLILMINLSVINGNESISLEDVFGNDSSFSGKAEITVKMLNQEQVLDAQIYVCRVLGDSICDVDYFVETNDDNGVRCAYCYCNGVYVCQRDSKIRKFNSVDDLLLFKEKEVRGRTIKGVHKTGIHSLLIPMFVVELVQDLIERGGSNFKYIADYVYDDKDVVILQVEEVVNDVIVRKMQFITEKKSKKPVAYNVISSPGAKGQMEIDIKFISVDEIFNEKNMVCAIKSLQNE